MALRCGYCTVKEAEEAGEEEECHNDQGTEPVDNGSGDDDDDDKDDDEEEEEEEVEPAEEAAAEEGSEDSWGVPAPPKAG